MRGVFPEFDGVQTFSERRLQMGNNTDIRRSRHPLRDFRVGDLLAGQMHVVKIREAFLRHSIMIKPHHHHAALRERTGQRFDQIKVHAVGVNGTGVAEYRRRPAAVPVGPAPSQAVMRGIDTIGQQQHPPATVYPAHFEGLRADHHQIGELAEDLVILHRQAAIPAGK